MVHNCLFVRILGKKLVWFPLLRLCIVYNMYHGVLVIFSPMLLFVGEKCRISFSSVSMSYIYIYINSLFLVT